MILNFLLANFCTWHLLVTVPKIGIPLLIFDMKSLLIALSTITIYSLSCRLLALKILLTISPSEVKKMRPSLGLSNLPIGKILLG